MGGAEPLKIVQKHFFASFELAADMNEPCQAAPWLLFFSPSPFWVRP
jgi:hypothetical protein